MVEGGEDVDPAVPISVAARKVGLSVDTLRIWERRYGLGPSRTSPGGHRRYGEADLRRLRAVVHLLGSGVPAGEAVRTILAATPAPSGAIADTRVRLPTGLHPAAHRLAAAALDLDGPGVRRLLGAELAAHGVVATWERLIRPLLSAIGEQWERVPYAIAVEHVLSHIATAALAVRTGPPAAPTRGGGRPVLLSCVPHEEHELPLTALAAALRERGVPATVLGARTPARTAWTGLLERAAAPETTVVLLAVVPDHADPALLRDVPDSVRLITAGPGWLGASVPRAVSHTNGLTDALRVVLDA